MDFRAERHSNEKMVSVALPDGTTRQLRGTNVIVSTGTRAELTAIPRLAEAEPPTHSEALALDEVPENFSCDRPRLRRPNTGANTPGNVAQPLDTGCFERVARFSMGNFR